jgi:hypothetical protein
MSSNATEDVKARYDALDKKKAAVVAAIDALDASVTASPEYQEAEARKAEIHLALYGTDGTENRYKMSDAERKAYDAKVEASLTRRENAAHERVFSLFTKDGDLAVWKNSFSGKTNIRDDVLAQIKAVTKISKLLGSQIESAVRDFQKRSLAGDEEYEDLVAQVAALQNEKAALDEKTSTMLSSEERGKLSKEYAQLYNDMKAIEDDALHPEKKVQKSKTQETRDAFDSDVQELIYDRIMASRRQTGEVKSE